MKKYIAVWKIEKSMTIEATTTEGARRALRCCPPVHSGDYVEHSFEILSIKEFPIDITTFK